MSTLVRSMAAGYGARKLGVRCIDAVMNFLVPWWRRGHFGVCR